MPIVAARTRVIGALKFKVIISAPCAPKIDLIEHRRHGLFDPCLGGCPLQDCKCERERAGGVAWAALGRTLLLCRRSRLHGGGSAHHSI